MTMNYYEILEIPRNASRDEIKKAYHKLALKYHPDKNQDISAEEKFKKIQEAYDVLKDDDKKRKYDRYGESGVKKNSGGYSNPFSDDPFTNPFTFTNDTSDYQYDNDAILVDDAVNFISSIFNLLNFFFIIAELLSIFSPRRRR